MKKTFFPWIFLVGLLIFSNNAFTQIQDLVPKGDQTVVLKTFDDSVAYAYGIMIGEQLIDQKIDVEMLKRGIDHKVAKTELLTKEQSKLYLKKDQQRREKERKIRDEVLAQKNKLSGEKFLTDNAKVKGVGTTPSGLQYKIMKQGTGNRPISTDKVKVHYEGKLLNGDVFDSSIKRNEPAVFGLNQVIKGWTEGLQLMQVGAKYQFFIPADLAYGRTSRPKIPAYSVLVFEVELLEIVKEDSKK